MNKVNSAELNKGESHGEFFIPVLVQGRQPAENVIGRNAKTDSKVDHLGQRFGRTGLFSEPGESLEAGGKLVRGEKQVVTDGPYAEAKDVVGGFTIVKVKNINEAVKLSKGCPIFESNGMVEVRPIRQL